MTYLTFQVYSTRVKPITSSPTFNAGTERFTRDWRTAHVSVIVRDSRMREEDPILGIVFLKVRSVSIDINNSPSEDTLIDIVIRSSSQRF